MLISISKASSYCDTHTSMLDSQHTVLVVKCSVWFLQDIMTPTLYYTFYFYFWLQQNRSTEYVIRPSLWWRETTFVRLYTAQVTHSSAVVFFFMYSHNYGILYVSVYKTNNTFSYVFIVLELMSLPLYLMAKIRKHSRYSSKVVTYKAMDGRGSSFLWECLPPVVSPQPFKQSLLSWNKCYHFEELGKCVFFSCSLPSGITSSGGYISHSPRVLDVPQDVALLPGLLVVLSVVLS